MKRIFNRIASITSMSCIGVSMSAAASAQDAAPAPAAQAPAPAPSATADADGARFRFGVSGGAGIMSWSGPTLTYGGADLRFGVQVNDLIGVYAQPQLGIYSGEWHGNTGVGGLLGGSALIDFTFSDQFFVGGGFGYGVLNNPSGAEIHLRGGVYPLYGGGEDVARRKGLMLGIDFRTFFIEGYTFIAPTLSIGYEAY